MISAFGVQHDGIAKAFDKHPKVRGQVVTLYRKNDKGMQTFAPDTMNIERKKPTLILRRPNYAFAIFPKVKPKKDDMLSVTPPVTLDRKTRRFIHEEMKGKTSHQMKYDAR